jgi:hypothetical protein
MYDESSFMVSFTEPNNTTAISIKFGNRCSCTENPRSRSVDVLQVGITPGIKNEHTMDDFSTLTIREPWLLKRVSMSKASVWLAGKGLMLQGRRDSRQGTKSTGLSKRSLQERKANDRVS